MSKSRFAAVARLATDAVSRRTSLAALGAVSLLAVTRPIGTEAAKAGKKAKRKCKRQASECRAFYVDVCDTNQFCIDTSNTCCAHFGRCAAGAAIACLSQLV
jgi:hypothetical protein